MDAPDKIYLTSTPYRILDGRCDSKTPHFEGMEQVEYIRKGALLEWAKKEKEKYEHAGFDKTAFAWYEVIDKLNSL